MKHGIIQIEDPSIITARKRRYVGVDPYPYTPINKGDVWEEYDTSNNHLKNWVYNGSAWISKNDYNFSFTNSNSTVLNATLNSPVYPVLTAYDLLLLNFNLVGYQNSTSTINNRWNFLLDTINAAGITSTITGFNTFTPNIFTANTWNTVVFPINTIVDTTNVKAFRVSESRVGNPTKNFSHVVEYKLVRV